VKSIPLPIVLLVIAAGLAAWKPDMVRAGIARVVSMFTSSTPVDPITPPPPRPAGALLMPAESLKSQLTSTGKDAAPLAVFYREFAESLEATPADRIALNSDFREVHRNATSTYAKLVPEVTGLGAAEGISEIFKVALGADDKTFDKSAAVSACRAIQWAATK